MLGLQRWRQLFNICYGGGRSLTRRASTHRSAQAAAMLSLPRWRQLLNFCHGGWQIYKSLRFHPQKCPGGSHAKLAALEAAVKFLLRGEAD